MEKRQALVIDRDAAFVSLLRETLGPYGFEIIATDDSRKGFVRLKMEPPALLFLAVDLPDRAGYSLCTRARRLKKGVPIVLATATLPDGEMALHEITKAHADAYLDKRALDSARLIRSLDRLIDLGPARLAIDPFPAADARESPGDASVAEDSPNESPTDTEAVESAVQALLADIEVHPSPSSLADEPISVPEDVAKDVPTLRLEVARLRRDLDATRRVLRASPSAADNMLLRDEIEDKDKELARLQESAFERDRGLTEARKRLEDLARQVLAGKLEKQRLSRSIDDQKARIETAETMLALAEDEIKELREQTDGEISRERAAHQATRGELERRLSEITTALEETKRGGAELQRRREGLERRIEELETARIETLREKEESLARMREEQAAAAFDLELKFESALMEKEREHEAAVAARQEAASEENQARIARREADFRADLDDAHVRHEKALAALRKIHTDMLAEKDLVLDSTRARVVEIEQALARSEHDRGAAQDRIGSLEETLRAQIEDLARARQSLEESERGGEEARRRLADFEKERVATEHAHQEALQKLRHDNSVIIEALQRERREDVAAQREHERQMIEARKMEHRTTLQKTTEEIDLLRAQSHERETALQERHERRISEIERKTEEAIRRLTKENEEAKARIARAEEDLAAAKRDLAERDEEIADQRGTISSLQALVGDFSTPATGAPSRPKIENT